jgi:hypothetical protein
MDGGQQCSKEARDKSLSQTPSNCHVARLACRRCRRCRTLLLLRLAARSVIAFAFVAMATEQRCRGKEGRSE